MDTNADSKDHSHHDFGVFPMLSITSEKPRIDCVTSCQFEHLCLEQLDISTSTLLAGAWAMVAGQMSRSEVVAFDILTVDNVPLMGKTSTRRHENAPVMIDTRADRNGSEYLQALQLQMTQGTSVYSGKQEKADFYHGKAHESQTLLTFQSSEPLSKIETFAKPGNHPDLMGESSYALNIEFQLHNRSLTATACFDSTAIAEWMMEKILQRLEFIAQQLQSLAPGQQLRDVTMITQQDLLQLWQWNGAVPGSCDRCFHHVFEETVQQQPDSPAVCAWDGKLTYKELDDFSNALAHELMKQGIEQGMIVPLCLEKSLWMTVAILGVLKAGGAFVLLDTALPEQRLESIVQQVKASLILCSPVTQTLSHRLVGRAIVVGTETLAALRHDEPSALPKCNSSSLMYLTFTSGSTGSPKGVMITHGNVTSGLFHQLGILGATKASRMFDFASYGFAAAISNLCVALGAGGCLCVPSEDDRKNKLPDVMRSFEVTMVDLGPSTARVIMNEDIPTLQLITFGGEALHARDVEPWWGRVRTMNIYGQSECTSYSTFNDNASTPDEAAGIGKGVGLITWVVDPDDYNHLLPIGCVGELLLEGPLVGSGYLDDPEKTRETFVEDPIWLCQTSSSHQGRHGRLYKTGDLVQYKEDGSLIYLGRKDSQVKIRGQRVELREVEHWIQSCMSSTVEQVVAEVITPAGANTGPILAAFLKYKNNHNVSNGSNELCATVVPAPAGLEAKLEKHLPSYMVPTVHICIQDFPMTATEKLNRKQLRQIGSSFPMEMITAVRMCEQNKKQNPTSRMEKLLQDIWSKVLHVHADTIGLDDNFFHLGGDSIAAMSVVAKARMANIALTVAHIFKKPTLRDLSHEIADLEIGHQKDILPFSLLGGNLDMASFRETLRSEYKLVPEAVCDAYPCTPLQEGFIFLTSKKPGDYIMQSVLDLSRTVRIQDLCRAWEQVFRALPILRTRIIQRSDLSLLQIVVDETLQWNNASNLSDYLAADREKPMGLGQSLTRYGLICDESGTVKWIVWTIHHALYDGWSIPLIWQAVYRAYQDKAPQRVVGFQPFIKYLQSQDKQAMSEYWREALSDHHSTPFPALQLSIKELRADTVANYSLSYPKNKSRGTTTAILIRAAWALVLRQMTNSDDVIFGVTVSGRNAPVAGIENMTGPTIATVPVRVRMAPDQIVSQYLESLQQQATDMIPFEQFGLQRISAISAATREACGFQNLLVIQPPDPCNTQSELGTRQDGNQDMWFSTYALTMELWLESDKITALATFDTRAIKPWIVDKLLLRLEHVLAQLDQASPSTSLGDIEISTSQDFDQIWEWNKTLPTGVDEHFHEMVERKAAAQPPAPAICAWDGELSYQQLNELANRLAIDLSNVGVGPGVLIPLCFEKSMWTSVAILGVLKAGGGFIMLDPSLPEERFQAILQQVKAKLIISSASHESLCKQYVSKVLTINELYFSDPSGNRGHLPSRRPSPSDIMYITFTSGSTGKPKGVMITYSNIASAVHYQAELMGITDSSRLFDFASYSFDGSINNMFMALAMGGCLCVPSDEDRKNHLEQSILSLQANTLDLTPSVGQLLSPEKLPQIRLVIFAGEALHATDIQRWWGKALVCNAYGPSECSPTSTLNPCGQSVQEMMRIGKGAGLVTWIVDPTNHNILLAPGCIGELLLEGPLVGLGYLEDPDKTAAVFIEDPVWLLQGTSKYPGRQSRLYKTGDLARYDHDGNIICLGRKDAQVKIRGQRVELGEIEHALRVHSLVDEAVVILHYGDIETGQRQDPHILGFVAIRSDDTDLVSQESSSNFVEVWAEHFDLETYTRIDETQVESLGRDFIGWTSMYDGKQIDKDDMNEWLDDTIRTLRNGHGPGHVIEIGSGSGMILFNLTDELDSYTGIEPSARAVEFIIKETKRVPNLTGKVSMFKATAADVGKLGMPTTPTLAILNSVIQYFPSQDYLLGVIRSLIEFNGLKTIFFGDVRSLALYREFLVTKTLHITGKRTTKQKLRRIMEVFERTEAELLVEPAFFTALQSQFPDQIEHVEILPKIMRATNELSCYRYAAVLHIKPPKAQPAQIRTIDQNSWVDFAASGLNRPALSELLLKHKADISPVAISNIPYRKTVLEKEVLQLLSNRKYDDDSDSDWLSIAERAAQDRMSLSPVDVVDIARAVGYKVEVSCARQRSQNGGFDAVFHQFEPLNGEERVRFKFPVDDDGQYDLTHTSRPLRQQQKLKTKDELYEMLRVKLPSYMIPHGITVLDEMPINRNGKVDRQALVGMYRDGAIEKTEIRKPAKDEERQMQDIWCRVLNVEPDVVGLDESFFELGGNSIAAMKVVAEARKIGLELSVADLFSHPKLQDLVGQASSSVNIDLMAEILRHDTKIASEQNKQAMANGVSCVSNDGTLSILLTGANGFIGTQIMRHLLMSSRVGRVIALVRAESTRAARNRTIDAAKKAQWWTDFHADKLEVWRGDLEQLHLGLSPENWSKLSSGKYVDIIIHNGASVHMMKSYSNLEAGNVKSTAEMLSVVVAHSRMRFVYVSSARYESPENEQEAAVCKDLELNATGYVQTKFVSESLVKRAAMRSTKGSSQFAIVSPGLVIGTTTEGVANVDDWIWRLAAACISAGVYNAEEDDEWIAVSDAGTTASTIVHAALSHSCDIHTPIRGGMRWGEFWSTLARTGYELQPSSAKEWMAIIRRDIEKGREAHPLWMLADRLETLAVEEKEAWGKCWHETDGYNTKLKVAVYKSAEFLAKVGFLPPLIRDTSDKALLTVADAFSRSF